MTEERIYLGDLNKLEFRNIGDNEYSKPSIVFIQSKWNDKEFELKDWEVSSLVQNVILFLDAIKRYNQKENKVTSEKLAKIKQALKSI